MSILGVAVRTRAADAPDVARRIAALPGADVALDPGDGRLVLVIEDAEVDGTLVGAASTLAAIALWPQVLQAHLVYEYSGPESPAAGGGGDYRAWRASLHDIAAPAQAIELPHDRAKGPGEN